MPSRYTGNRQLAVWVKRQRRQYKFYAEGKPSSMTADRIKRLEEVGFEWDMRRSRGDGQESYDGSDDNDSRNDISEGATAV